jgi:hypothetical protein
LKTKPDSSHQFHYKYFLFTFFTLFLKKGKHLKSSFIDRLRIFVKSGTGGFGSAQYGGIGGDGIREMIS